LQRIDRRRKAGCADLVFNKVCIEILSSARNVLSDEQFKQLVVYATEKMKEKITLKFQSELTLWRQTAKTEPRFSRSDALRSSAISGWLHLAAIFQPSIPN
jgi:hypothetical protein